MDDPRWDAGAMEAFGQAVFGAMGLPREHAVAVAQSLVAADLTGVSTHGVARIPSYVDRFRRGVVNPAPALRVESAFPWSVAIDADNAMGAVAASAAVQAVRSRVATLGIGAATVRGSNHFGAAGYYARQLAGDDCVGLCLSPASKSLAPFGSREPLLGTNPWAVSTPAGRHPNWTMDMATSVAARGHIRLAARSGAAIPEGWALDAEGRATTDAAAALKGVMLPFAGPKGSGIAMMVEVLGGVLSGSGFAGGIRDMNTDFSAPQDVGHFFLAFKIAGFMRLEQFNARMETMIDRLRALAPAAGHDTVRYPGEPEAIKEAANRAAGIRVPAETVTALRGLAEELGIGFPAPLGT